MVPGGCGLIGEQRYQLTPGHLKWVSPSVSRSFIIFALGWGWPCVGIHATSHGAGWCPENPSFALLTIFNRVQSPLPRSKLFFYFYMLFLYLNILFCTAQSPSLREMSGSEM